MNTLTKSPEVARQTDKYVQEMRGGKKLAVSALDYLGTRGFWNIRKDILERRIPDIAKHASSLLLSLPNTINSVTDNNKVDPSIFCVMHESLTGLMTSADDVQITRTQLVQYCLRYCRESALIIDGQTLKDMENQLFADINGVWHELNWENALLCSSAIAEHSNRSEDLSGIDLWIKMDDGLDLGVDVKTTKEGAYRHAQKNGLDINHEYSFTSNPQIEGSFEVSLLVDSTGEKVYLVMDNPPYSNNISPVDFRKMSAEINTVKLLLEKIEELGPGGANILQIHHRIENGNSVMHKSLKRQNI